MWKALGSNPNSEKIYLSNNNNDNKKIKSISEHAI